MNLTRFTKLHRNSFSVKPSCMRFLKYFTMLILLLVIGQAGTARETNALSSDNDSSRIITLKNDKVKVEILLVNDGFLLEDRIMDSHAQLTTDADFAFEITWTDWRAPAKQNNADNPARLTKKDFRFTSSLDKGKQEVILNFTGKDQPLLLQPLLDQLNKQGRLFHLLVIETM